MPNLSTSYLGPEAAPNSTLQQAVSKWTGQRDHTLPQFIAYPNGLSIAFTSTSPSRLTMRLKFEGLRSSVFIWTIISLSFSTFTQESYLTIEDSYHTFNCSSVNYIFSEKIFRVTINIQVEEKA
jgi:hypothetical protein